MIRILLPLPFLLAGCTIPITLPYAEVCTMDHANGYVGQVYSERMAKIIKGKTYSYRVRAIPPGTTVTQEFDRKRVNIVTDERNRIARIYCG